jgi:hypothetical protein
LLYAVLQTADPGGNVLLERLEVLFDRLNAAFVDVAARAPTGEGLHFLLQVVDLADREIQRAVQVPVEGPLLLRLRDAAV